MVQYGVPKTPVFATSFGSGENMGHLCQNLLQKPSQNVRSINVCSFLGLRHAHWLPHVSTDDQTLDLQGAQDPDPRGTDRASWRNLKRTTKRLPNLAAGNST